ncbi:MAG: hypothetical protein AAF940_02790 [Pseudomonadota bacterium]
MPDHSTAQGQPSGLEAYRYLIRVEANCARLDRCSRTIIEELTKGFRTSKTLSDLDLKPSEFLIGDIDAQPREGYTCFSFQGVEHDPVMLVEITEPNIPIISELILGASGTDAFEARGNDVSDFERGLFGVFIHHVRQCLSLDIGPVDSKAPLVPHQFPSSLTRPAYQAFDLRMECENFAIEVRLMISHRALLANADDDEIAPPQSEFNRAPMTYSLGADTVLDARIEISGTTLGEIAALSVGDLIPVSGPGTQNLLHSETAPLWTFVLGEQAGTLAIQLMEPTGNKNAAIPADPTADFNIYEEFKEALR